MMEYVAFDEWNISKLVKYILFKRLIFLNCDGNQIKCQIMIRRD